MQTWSERPKHRRQDRMCHSERGILRRVTIWNANTKPSRHTSFAFDIAAAFSNDAALVATHDPKNNDHRGDTRSRSTSSEIVVSCKSMESNATADGPPTILYGHARKHLERCTLYNTGLAD